MVMEENEREKADGIINGTNEIVTRRALVTRQVPKGIYREEEECAQPQGCPLKQRHKPSLLNRRLSLVG